MKGEINIAAIRDRIAIIKLDERLTYPHANVFVNAPLAIVQIQLTTELHTLERILGIEKLTSTPIKRPSRKVGKEEPK